MSTLSSDDITSNIAARATYSDNLIGDTLVSGGCRQWRSFLQSDLVTNSLLYRVQALTVYQFRLSFDGSVLSNSTFQCRSFKNVSAIVSHLNGNALTDLNIYCDGFNWKVKYCAAAGLPSVCVSCNDPCASSKPSTGLVVINPCSGNIVTRKSSLISILSGAFSELKKAPDITTMTTTASRTSLSVKIIAAGAGTVNCAVFLSSAIVEPSSQSIILLQNYGSSLQRNLSTITIPNLLAATSYDVYCMTTAVSGSKLSLSKILATKVTLKTLCCKSMYVSLNSLTSYEMKNVLNMITITADSPPSLSVSASVSAVNLIDGSKQSTFFPSIVSMDTTFSKSQQLFVSLIGLQSGSYNVSVVLSGDSRSEYSFFFPKGSAFNVLATGSEPPTPLILSALFLNDGSKISIIFDSMTNKGLLGTIFSCSILMVFPGDSMSTCQWIDGATIYVTPYISAVGSIKIGDSIRLKSYPSLKALCTSTAASCLSWKTVSSVVVVVQKPTNPISPIVAISAPASIGSCDSLVIDASGSSGNCGRPWSNFSVAVSSSTGNTSLVQNFFSYFYRPNPPTPIPARYLEKGVTYNFLVSMCNFLGSCGQSSARVLVLTSIVPSVSILGPFLRSFSRSSPLSLTSNAYVMSCDGAQSSAGIRYSWSVLVNNIEDFSISSRSKDPSKFLVPSYSLRTLVLYTIKLSVSQVGNPKTSSTSAQVYIIQSNIVAAISGGLIRSMHPQQTLTIDGSSSYDEDIPGLTGSDAGLIFSWSCNEISPQFLNTCGVTVVGGLYTSSYFSLLADSTSVNSVSQIVLTVYDADKKRSAQSTLSLTVVDDSTPQVALTSDSASSLNPSKALLLTANVQIPSSATGSATWSVDDTSVDINKITALPVSVSVSKTTILSQLILANTLPIGATLSFTLNIVLQSGKTSSASVAVSTNAPPQPGLFRCSPSQGIEVQTGYQFSALQWLDSSLPISYQFGVVTSSGSYLSLQSRSESSFGTTSLSAGLQSMNYTQTLFVQVYDNLNSSSLAYTSVIVTPMGETNSTALKNSLLSKLSSGNSSVNGIKSSTALVSSILNSVNCSSAPNCTALNRFDCTTVINTCGNCLSADFIGDSISNSPCLSLSALRNSRRKLVDGKCSTSQNCIVPPYLECSSSRVCVIPAKRCIEDCSGHGTCSFVQVDNGAAVDSCLITDATCGAVCVCDADWQGSSCSFTADDMANRNDMRHQVVQSLSSLMSLEDPTDESISSWSQSLVTATQSFDQLHSSTLNSVQSLVDTIIESAISTGATHDKAGGVLGSLDSVFKNVALSAQTTSIRRRLQGFNSSSPAHDHSALITSSQSSLEQYSKLVSSSMIAGQDAVSSIQDQYRISTSVFTADSNNVSLVAPLSAAEKFSGLQPPSMQIIMKNSTDNLKLSTVLLNSNLFSNSDFNSNPFQLNVNSGLSQCSSESDCFIRLVLQNNVATNISSVASSPVMKTVICTSSNLGLVQVPCPNEQIAHVRCNSTGQTIVIECPIIHTHAVCNALMGSSASSSGCKTVNFTATETTCLCPLSSHQISGLSDHGRRLKKTKIVESSNSTYTPLSGSISFVAMLQSISSSFLSTATSAQSLNASSIQKSWQVLVTIGVFALTVVVCALGAHYADERDLREKVFPEKASRISDSIFSRWFRSKQKPKKVMQQGDQKSPELRIIEASLPNVLRSKPVLEKIVEENRHFHKYFGIAFHFSPLFPRVLRVLSLTTSVVSMLFIQALTYSINNPDDGSCELQTTRRECLAQTSSLQEGAPKCYYTYDNGVGACHFNQPASNIQVVMFVAIFAATISTPIAVSADWIIGNLLNSKTKVSAVSPQVAEELSVVLEADPSSESKSLVVKTSFDDEFNDMTTRQQHYKDSLTSEQAKEFTGTASYFLLLVFQFFLLQKFLLFQ